MLKQYRKTAIFGLSALLSCSGIALAQDTNPREAPPSFEELAGDGGAAPAEGGLPFGDPAVPPKKELTPEEKAAEVEEINANYDATLDIYDSILERRDTDPTMLERRINSNKELLERYQPRLTEAEQRLRVAQVGYMNRLLDLKRQHERGELTDEEFEEAVERDRLQYEKRKLRIKDDRDFYKTEMQTSSGIIDELTPELKEKMRHREMIKAQSPQEKDPNVEAVNNVFSQLEQLSGFKVRLTMDGVAGYRRYDHMHKPADD